MSKRDYYEVLGVERSVDEKALKSAYRKLAMKYHPDQNAGDASAEEKFKEVGEAYAVLSDPQKRAAYDRYGHGAFENGGMGGSPFGQGGTPEDIFQFFKNPPLEETQADDIKQGRLSTEALKRVMCDEHDFSEERLDSALKKLEKAGVGTGQAKLGSFFGK